MAAYKDKAIALFNQLDADNNGSVTRRELVDGLEAITGDRQVALSIAVDVLEKDDGDEVINKEEFMAAVNAS